MKGGLHLSRNISCFHRVCHRVSVGLSPEGDGGPASGGNGATPDGVGIGGSRFAGGSGRRGWRAGRGHGVCDLRGRHAVDPVAGEGARVRVGVDPARPSGSVRAPVLLGRCGGRGERGVSGASNVPCTGGVGRGPDGCQRGGGVVHGREGHCQCAGAVGAPGSAPDPSGTAAVIRGAPRPDRPRGCSCRRSSAIPGRVDTCRARHGDVFRTQGLCRLPECRSGIRWAFREAAARCGPSRRSSARRCPGGRRRPRAGCSRRSRTGGSRWCGNGPRCPGRPPPGHSRICGNWPSQP